MTLLSEKIQFYQLCQVFENIRDAPRDKKAAGFKKFIRSWHEELKKSNPEDGSFELRSDDTFYEALRLFAPSKDDRKFAMKETKLTRLVCDALLTEHMDTLTTATDILVERLADKVCETLSVSSPTLSIKQYNDMLDRMKFPTEKRQQEKVMGELFRICTRLELRWTFYILLDAMEKALGGVSSAAILRWFHKDALDAFMSGDSLQQICESFVGEESGETVLAANGNIVGKPFRPMLLKRLNYDKYCLPKIIKFCSRPFYAEYKYDGEHLLVHRYNFNHYKYFTRNGIDYTHKMGSDSQTLLSARIHPFFRPNVRECVIDCELLLWDQKIQSFVGKSKRASDGQVYDVKHIDDDFLRNHSYLQRSLAVFDVLYINGRSLIDIPLEDRLKELEGVFSEASDKSTFFISKKDPIQTAKEFSEFYTRAMRNGEEGIVVKAYNSKYRPGSRAERNGWFKIKPDYGLQSVLDLAVVGIRYENSSLSSIKSFLVAARLPGPQVDLQLKIVAAITSRLKILDFKRLMTLLRGSGNQPLLEGMMPNWLVNNNGKPGKNDRFVRKENIQVVEVRASGLLHGILQFPSIVSIRNDKSVNETDSFDDVLRFDERLRSRPIIDETDPHEAAVLLNRKRKLNLELKQSHQVVRDTDGMLEGTLSDALKGRKVCVLNGGSGVTSQDLQKILISLGATPIANPGKIADFLVAMDNRPITCVAAIKANNYHIVHGNWLLKCKERGMLLPWEQSDMIHISSKAQFDLFSVPSASNVTAEGSEKTVDEEAQQGEADSMDDYSSTTSSADGEVGAEEMSNADMALSEEATICQEVEGIMNSRGRWVNCAAVEETNLFTDFVFHFHESAKSDQEAIEGENGRRLEELKRQIETKGGRVVDELNSTVTHVVISNMNSDQADALFDWNEKQKQWEGQFITCDWLDQAINDGDRYRVGEQLHKWIRHEAE